MANQPRPEAPPGAGHCLALHGAGRCLALAGPTAAGKTAAAMAIARTWPTEIISVDSALVYRGMDIGSAKPSPAERAAVPHHLIDIRDPLQAYSAAEFAMDAARLIGEIHSRGALALLTGGTMLYFKALFEGLDPLPRTDPAVRARVAAQAQQIGWPALHARLAQHDPVTAARLHPGDTQRIGRALEVWEMTGRTLSSWYTMGHAGRSAEPGPAMPLLSLEPQERAWLHDRIAQRFDAMLGCGLLDEVRTLRQRGDLSGALASMRCVGYRQAWEVLEGSSPAGSLRDKGIYATRQLAKRQLTWLRGMARRRVIACDAPDAIEQVLAQARAALEPQP